MDNLLVIFDPKVVGVSTPLLEASTQPFQVDLPDLVTRILTFIVLLNDSTYFRTLDIRIFNIGSFGKLLFASQERFLLFGIFEDIVGKIYRVHDFVYLIVVSVQRSARW